MSRVTLGGVVETGQGPWLLSSHPDPSVLSSLPPTHTRPTQSSPVPGVGEQGEEDPAEQGDLLAGVSWVKEQGRLCFLSSFFRGVASGSLPARTTQGRAWTCSQEWLPPTPRRVGMSGLEPWDSETGEEAVGIFRPLALVASLFLG